MMTPILTTLGFVMHPDAERVLMVHRIARPGDEQLGKYNGLGGKVEPGEDVVAGMRRELREEAELAADEKTTIIDDHRLVYQSDSMVNWCPGLGTVLANEEVTAEGRSERGNFPVFTRRLRQWKIGRAHV